MKILGTGEKKKGVVSKRRKKAGRAVYQANCKAERKRFTNVMQSDDQKCDVFKTVKRVML